MERVKVDGMGFAAGWKGGKVRGKEER